MPVTPYFNHFSPANRTSEQNIYEDILVESIKMMGHDVYYLPRSEWENTDKIFGENIYSKFEHAFKLEMFINNVNGWEGDSDFFSKFGLEIRENAGFILARRTFEKHIPKELQTRPREGDLIYVPLFNKVFEIKFVEEELMFYAQGKRSPYLFELRCEVFRSAQEIFNTGVEEVDALDNEFRYTIELTVGGTGNYYNGEVIYQGNNLATANATAKLNSWDPNNRKLYLVEIVGAFTSGNVKGANSNTSCLITTNDTLVDSMVHDFFDNKDIQAEANNIITLDNNPFGSPN